MSQGGGSNSRGMWASSTNPQSRLRPVAAQNGGTPAYDSGGAQLGGFFKKTLVSCKSQRAFSRGVREGPPRGTPGRGLDSVNAIFSLTFFSS